MKTDNLNAPGEYGHARTRGHVGGRAGSSGISVSDAATEADGVTEIVLRGATVTDDGDGTATVTIESGTATLTAMTPAQLAANTNDWDPTVADLTLADVTIIRASTDASRNLTGIVAPTAERLLILENVGAFDLVLKHDATSTAANRFYCPNDADFTVHKDSAVSLAYDATSARWRVVENAPDLTTIAPTTFTFPAATSPAQTAEGSAVWDSDDDKLTVGTGSARKTLVNEGAVTTSGLTMATSKVLGRTTASTGAIEEVAIGTGLVLSSGTLRATGSGGGSSAYMSRRVLVTPTNANQTFNVNSTSYQAIAALSFHHDWDLFPASHFLISCFACNNESTRTVTLQLATVSAAGTPYSAGGDDLAIPFNSGNVQSLNSGWVAVAAAHSGVILMCIAIKGSTATVDLVHQYIDILFKIA